jgi:RNA12 protein
VTLKRYSPFPISIDFADSHTKLCHKVKNGMPVEMAVEDIITRGVGELRKNAFGEIDEAQSMGWSKEQVFFILKALAKSDEVSFVTECKLLS